MATMNDVELTPALAADQLTHYDYEHQCWVQAGPLGTLIVARCGHLQNIAHCYSCDHAGHLHVCVSRDACPDSLVLR